MMKRVLLFLLAIAPVFLFGQNDTTKYYKSRDYGWEYPRLKITRALILPVDTVNNKLGFAVIGSTAYAGDGVKWTALTGFGGGGSGISGLTSLRIPYATSATTIGDDAGLTYAPLLNELRTDSIDLKTLRADTGLFVGMGRYDYDNSFWRPGIRFAEEDRTGIARLGGITTFIDNGQKNVGIWREGADTDVIYGYGANRLTVEATGSMNLVSLVGRMEFEGIGNGGWIDWVGYQAGSSIGRTIRITTDATSFGNSVVPIHFVPRNGFHAFRITDSLNNPYTHFNFRGWLGIGNDTAQRHIHVRNNGDVFERLESLSLTGNIGHEYFVQGNERWSNKLDVNSGQITENIGTGGYFKRWQVNGTNAMGLDADRTVFINNRLFIGTTSSLGLGEKLAVNGSIGIADGSQIVETSGNSGVIISTAEGTSIFYGTGSTRGKVQANPNFSYLYGSAERFRISTDGEVRINPAGPIDLGDFTLQNTGGFYQQGVFRLGGNNAASAPYSILTKQGDSTVSNLLFPGGTTQYLRADGTWATVSGGGGGTWGSITGTLSSQTDLALELDSAITSISIAQDSIQIYYRNNGQVAYRDTIKAFAFTGSLQAAGDGRSASLVNDQTSPGNSRYYGTNSSGTKGYNQLNAAAVGLASVSDNGSTVSVSTTLAIAGTQTVTSGTSGTVNGGVYRFEFDPASVLASYTLTMPASPADGQQVVIRTGRQIAAGSTTVTSFTLSPNSGQTLFAAITPTVIVSGDVIIYEYETASTTWFRIK